MESKAVSQKTVRNRLVVRLLPPAMQEEEFWSLISQTCNHDTCDDRYYVQGKTSSKIGKSPSYSRAYLSFKSPEYLKLFYKTFKQLAPRLSQIYDERCEARVKVEYAPFQDNLTHSESASPDKDDLAGTIGESDFYKRFVEHLEDSKVDLVPLYTPPPPPKPDPRAKSKSSNKKSKKQNDQSRGQKDHKTKKGDKPQTNSKEQKSQKDQKSQREQRSQRDSKAQKEPKEPKEPKDSSEPRKQKKQKDQKSKQNQSEKKPDNQENNKPKSKSKARSKAKSKDPNEADDSNTRSTKLLESQDAAAASVGSSPAVSTKEDSSNPQTSNTNKKRRPRKKKESNATENATNNDLNTSANGHSNSMAGTEDTAKNFKPALSEDQSANKNGENSTSASKESSGSQRRRRRPPSSKSKSSDKKNEVPGGSNAKIDAPKKEKAPKVSKPSTDST